MTRRFTNISDGAYQKLSDAIQRSRISESEQDLSLGELLTENIHLREQIANIVLQTACLREALHNRKNSSLASTEACKQPDTVE